MSIPFHTSASPGRPLPTHPQTIPHHSIVAYHPFAYIREHTFQHTPVQWQRGEAGLRPQRQAKYQNSSPYRFFFPFSLLLSRPLLGGKNRTFASYANDIEAIESATPLDFIGTFIGVLLGSLAIGVLVALLCAFVSFSCVRVFGWAGGWVCVWLGGWSSLLLWVCGKGWCVCVCVCVMR